MAFPTRRSAAGSGGPSAAAPSARPHALAEGRPKKGAAAKKAVRKRADRYHHGSLASALVAEAVRTIEKHGADALTLRAVGASLGVSRTALYRHYADKNALLEAVSKEGFRLFRAALADAWNDAGRGGPGFAAMGEAYVRFALDHPSHYRVMFSGQPAKGHRDPEHEAEGAAAFQVLVDSLLELQRAGTVPGGEDVTQLARYIWSVVHGVAMLALDGRLESRADAEGLARYAVARLRDSLGGRSRP